MRVSKRNAEIVNWGIMIGGTVLGALHPDDPALWFQTMFTIWICTLAPILVGGWLVQRLSDRFGQRIQGPRRAEPPIAKEIYETARAMYVVAIMAAWPVTKHRLGHDTGLVWTVEEMAPQGWPMMLLWFWVGIVAADAWTYWKHRILHTRALFAFHAEHHTFRDPTCFAGFAISPLEAMLTFCPLLLAIHPAMAHFVPAYVTLIAAFVVLNLYLHCGVRFEVLERVLPRLLLNSSAHHNPHHSRANVNFGEVSWFWDWVCGTSEGAIDRARAARKASAATWRASEERSHVTPA